MMRIASKSVIGLVSSNGFERNKATLLGGPFGARRGISRDSLAGPPFPGSGGYRFQEGHRKTHLNLRVPQASLLRPGIPRSLVGYCCNFRRRSFLQEICALDQLHVE